MTYVAFLVMSLLSYSLVRVLSVSFLVCSSQYVTGLKGVLGIGVCLAL